MPRPRQSLHHAFPPVFLPPQLLADGAVLLACLFFLVSFFPPSLMLSSTTTTGGDMGSHYVLASYLHDYLLPEGKVIGWYPGWMAGLPMFQYYFFPVYLFMALLGTVIPLQVAFKLGAVLGTFLLPFAAYFCMKWMGFRFPAPAVAAALSIPFLFNESYSIFGGNIPSTLAGEISYSVSFALTFLFLGWLFRQQQHPEVERAPLARRLLGSALLLCGVLLTHIYPSLFTGISATFFAFTRNIARWKSLVVVSLLGMGLAAFWVLPFLLKLKYASPLTASTFIAFSTSPYWIEKFWFIYLFAGIAVAAAVLTRAVNLLFLTYSAALSIGFFFLPLPLPLDFHRVLPLTLFTLFLLAAAGFSFLLELLAPLIRMCSEATEFARILACILAVAFLFWFTLSTTTFVGSWIQWNFSGLEGKAQYPAFEGVTSFLASQPLAGRVDFEYSAAYNSMGTPRVFEASPLFTHKPVMEALLLESSSTFPFFFYIQKLVSNETWWPGYPIAYPPFNLTQGAERLALYNVKYYVAYTNSSKLAADSNPAYHFIQSVTDFRLYSLNENSHFVEPVTRSPTLVVTHNWQNYSFAWFAQEHLDAPLVYVDSPDSYDLAHFSSVAIDPTLPYAALDSDGELLGPNETIAYASRAPKISEPCSVNSTLWNERVEIRTTCIGVPLLVKIPYFPNWQVVGAQKIYRATPNLMLVIPDQQDVTFTYGLTLADWLGIVISFFALAGVLALVAVANGWWKLPKYLKN